MSLTVRKLSMLKTTIEYKAEKAKVTGQYLKEEEITLRNNAESILNKVRFAK